MYCQRFARMGIKSRLPVFVGGSPCQITNAKVNNNNNNNNCYVLSAVCTHGH